MDANSEIVDVTEGLRRRLYGRNRCAHVPRAFGVKKRYDVKKKNGKIFRRRLVCRLAIRLLSNATRAAADDASRISRDGARTRLYVYARPRVRVSRDVVSIRRRDPFERIRAARRRRRFGRRRRRLERNRKRRSRQEYQKRRIYVATGSVTRILLPLEI